MECPELRELTASERLTLEEEYAMQRTWRVDEDSEYVDHNPWIN